MYLYKVHILITFYKQYLVMKYILYLLLLNIGCVNF